jgi:hypothetical protein
MPEIGSWNNHKFEYTPTLIRGFEDLSIKSGSETKDKTSSSQGYVSRKNAKADEVSLTVKLSALTGCNPRDEANAFIKEARDGATAYMYIGGAKLVPCKLMLTDATVNEIKMVNGLWVSCSVQLTLRQAGKYDGSSSSSSSSSSSKKKKTSAQTSTPASNTKPSTTTQKEPTENAKNKIAALQQYQNHQSALKAAAAAVKAAGKNTGKTLAGTKIVTVTKTGAHAVK